MLNVETLIAKGATIKKYKSGEYIFHEGARCLYYYQLLIGHIRIISETEQGKDFLHEIIFPYSCFGELPLFDNQPFAISAVAESDCEIITLSKDKFYSLIDENEDIHLLFLKHLAGKMRFEINRAKELSYLDPKHRVEALLNYFNENKHCINDKKDCIICPVCSKVKLTRQQIADMTGLRVETVIRTIKKMEEEGFVKIINGKVYLDVKEDKVCTLDS